MSEPGAGGGGGEKGGETTKKPMGNQKKKTPTVERLKNAIFNVRNELFKAALGENFIASEDELEREKQRKELSAVFKAWLEKTYEKLTPYKQRMVNSYWNGLVTDYIAYRGQPTARRSASTHRLNPTPPKGEVKNPLSEQLATPEKRKTPKKSKKNNKPLPDVGFRDESKNSPIIDVSATPQRDPRMDGVQTMYQNRQTPQTPHTPQTPQTPVNQQLSFEQSPGAPIHWSGDEEEKSDDEPPPLTQTPSSHRINIQPSPPSAKTAAMAAAIASSSKGSYRQRRGLLNVLPLVAGAVAKTFEIASTQRPGGDGGGGGGGGGGGPPGPPGPPGGGGGGGGDGPPPLQKVVEQEVNQIHGNGGGGGPPGPPGPPGGGGGGFDGGEGDGGGGGMFGGMSAAQFLKAVATAGAAVGAAATVAGAGKDPKPDTANSSTTPETGGKEPQPPEFPTDPKSMMSGQRDGLRTRVYKAGHTETQVEHKGSRGTTTGDETVDRLWKGDKFLNNPTFDEAEATLRPRYGIAGAGDVIPSTAEQMRSDLEFDLFSVVQPGHGEGVANKQFLYQEARDKHIRFADPLYSPNVWLGPLNTYHPLPWKWESVKDQRDINAYNAQVLARRMSAGNVVRAHGESSAGAFGRDVPQIPVSRSSSGLPREIGSPFEPIIHNRCDWTPNIDPAGYLLGRRGLKRPYSAWRSPTEREYQPDNGGPTLRKRRALEVILP
jgi:hypothetical protein